MGGCSCACICRPHVGQQIKVVGCCQLPLSPDVRQIIAAKCQDDIEQLPLSANPIRTTIVIARELVALLPVP